MKIKVTLKDPDGFYESVREAARESLPAGLSRDEEDAAIDIRMDAAWDALDKWVEYKEYVSIEFDTEAGTAVVVSS